jgi:hypothetical protein
MSILSEDLQGCSVVRHFVIVDRSNNGVLDIPTVANIRGMKIARIIYDGEDLDECHLMRVMIPPFIRGFAHLNPGVRPYTTIVALDDGGDYVNDSLILDWKSDDARGVKLDKLKVDVSVDGKSVKHIELRIELELYIC